MIRWVTPDGMLFRPFTLLGVVSLILVAGCSSAGGLGIGQPVIPDPSTVSQVNSRLLNSHAAPGFNVSRPLLGKKAQRSTAAWTFVSPRGGTDQICSGLMMPGLNFRPVGLLTSSVLAGVPNPGLYSSPPSWEEDIDVYPGTGAAAIVTAIPQLIGQCGKFAANSAAEGITGAYRETVTPLHGVGDQALHVSVRPMSQSLGQSGDDWVVIRSDRTLIWILSTYFNPVTPIQVPGTLRFAQDAWHRYSSVRHS